MLGRVPGSSTSSTVPLTTLITSAMPLLSTTEAAVLTMSEASTA